MAKFRENSLLSLTHVAVSDGLWWLPQLFSSCDFIHNMFGRHAQIDDNDPNAALTRRRVDAIKKTCKSSGLLKRRFVAWLRVVLHCWYLHLHWLSDSTGVTTWRNQSTECLCWWVIIVSISWKILHVLCCIIFSSRFMCHPQIMIVLLLVAIILGVLYGKWFVQHGPLMFFVAPPRLYGTLICFQ